MEIDRINGGKTAKGKGKGKNVKGKSKGKEQKGKGKPNGKQNQWSFTSPVTWSTTPPGGKGGDQNDKGKDSCGKVGHMAKDCWRVRQVGDPDVSGTVVSSVNGQESVGPSASQLPTAVKRVALVFGEVSPSSSPVVFGLMSDETSSWCHGRMVKFYYIGEEEEDQFMSVRNTTFGAETAVSYEIDTNEVDIIIDSGADAPIFLSSMIHYGQHYNG